MDIQSKQKSLRQVILPLLIQAYRACRRAFYRALGPLDYVSRVANDKSDFPPADLRRYVGALRNFEASGAEFAAYLKLIAKLQTHERLLDIGCGCGTIALNLVDYLESTGCYVGVDLDQSCVGWCQRKITPRNDRFKFECLDVRNDVYRPKGQHAAEDVVLPFDDGSFDVIVLKSVFTHLRLAEVDNYLKEISRLLAGGGRCLATFFLLDGVDEPAPDQGRPKIDMAFGDDQCRWQTLECPERAIAYKQSRITEMLSRHGLAVKERHFGSWSGRPDFLSFQDVLLIEKLSSPPEPIYP